MAAGGFGSIGVKLSEKSPLLHVFGGGEGKGEEV